MSTSYGMDGLAFESQERQEIFDSPKPPRRTLEPNTPLPLKGLRCYSPGVKRSGREFEHLFSSSAKAKRKWNYTSNPPYDFMAWTRITLPLLHSLHCVVHI